jgi:phage antirepressor YoqD-like protein
MLDFNDAHSNSANASKRKKKAEAKKQIVEQALAACEGKVQFYDLH